MEKERKSDAKVASIRHKMKICVIHRTKHRLSIKRFASRPSLRMKFREHFKAVRKLMKILVLLVSVGKSVKIRTYLSGNTKSNELVPQEL